MADSLSDLFKSLSINDVRVDAAGNIRIINGDIHRKIADLKGGFDEDAIADSVNTGTCINTACLVPGIDQLRSFPQRR
jgi:hypothetical protein